MVTRLWPGSFLVGIDRYRLSLRIECKLLETLRRRIKITPIKASKKDRPLVLPLRPYTLFEMGADPFVRHDVATATP